jgi:hypothetical protein
MLFCLDPGNRRLRHVAGADIRCNIFTKHDDRHGHWHHNYHADVWKQVSLTDVPSDRNVGSDLEN